MTIDAIRNTTQPSLAVVNARIWTGDIRRHWTDALFADGKRFSAVGSSAEIMKRVRSTTRVADARGMLVVPGLIDPHVHFLPGGMGLWSVLLRDAATPHECADRIARFARPRAAGAWIRNGDWDDERWGGALLSRAWIDADPRDHPVWVNRVDGHMALANSLAL